MEPREFSASDLQVRYLGLAGLQPGAIVNGRYRVERLIGRGGFGMVFLARDLTLKAPVALKFFDPQSLREQKKFLRVQREINLSRRISDPRIVKIFSLETWSGIWFMAMELVEGQNLKERLKESGPFRWEEFRPLFSEILKGVGSLHEQGIIHRDLKPSNIMVGPGGEIKILDFGLAKEIGDLEKTSSIGEIVGSPYYLSPEQIQGRELGVASDIYQLGILLFQALTNAFPFPETTTMNLVLMHLSQKPDRIATRGARVPGIVEFTVAKALAKRPQDRFRNTTEMAERLRQGRVPLLSSLTAVVPRALRLAVLAVATLSLAAAAYFATYGSRQIHSLQSSVTAVRGLNRFGRAVWRRDFAPFRVHLARLVRTPGRWQRYPQQNPVEKLNDSLANRLQHMPVPLALIFLSHPGKGVFARDGSVNSDRFDNQLAVLGANGRLLDKKSYSAAFELQAYDFAPMFTNGALVESGTGAEKLSLFYLQNFQGMYPSALLAANGTCFSVLCGPGVIVDAKILRNDSQGGSLLVLGANNLLSHMAYLTEWNFSPLTKNRLNMFPDYSQDPGFTPRDFLAVIPSASRIDENRWQEQGWAIVSEGNERKTIRVHRDGRMEVNDGGRVAAYRDDPATLAQAYGLVNECFQQKTVAAQSRKSAGTGRHGPWTCPSHEPLPALGAPEPERRLQSRPRPLPGREARPGGSAALVPAQPRRHEPDPGDRFPRKRRAGGHRSFPSLLFPLPEPVRPRRHRQLAFSGLRPPGRRPAGKSQGIFRKDPPAAISGFRRDPARHPGHVHGRLPAGLHAPDALRGQGSRLLRYPRAQAAAGPQPDPGRARPGPRPLDPGRPGKILVAPGPHGRGLAVLPAGPGGEDRRDP